MLPLLINVSFLGKIDRKIDQSFDNLEHSQTEILALLGKPENELLPSQKNISGNMAESSLGTIHRIN